jgi:hypothetical protein
MVEVAHVLACDRQYLLYRNCLGDYEQIERLLLVAMTWEDGTIDETHAWRD